MNTIRYVEHPSPVGALRIAASATGLVAIHMESQRHMPVEPDPTWSRLDRSAAAQAVFIDAARAQLDDYFARRRTRFALQLAVSGTVFQRRVWDALNGIAYGRTVSYGELARRIGNPQAVRAVGLANGRNPLAIVVPCHRVIGADGAMTGYGGGLARKVFLLQHESQAAGAG